MVWFKVDDKMHSHPKARKAGVEAMGLWVLCGSWSSDQLTDGFIPDYIADSFARNAPKLAASLVSSGLWEPAERDGDTGWIFHEWDERNPTRSDVESKRGEERQRKADWRASKKAKASQSEARVPDVSQWDNFVHPDGTTSSVPDVSQESPLYPDPTRPDPSIKTCASDDAQGANATPQLALVSPLGPELKRKPKGDYDQPGFAEFWQAYPRKYDKKKAATAYKSALKRANPSALIAGAERYAVEVAGRETRVIKLGATWLNNDCWENQPEPHRAPPRQTEQRHDDDDFQGDLYA